MKLPLKAQTFLSLLEINLMDFRNCSCACTAQQHKWAINIIDHHTKFVHVLPLQSKSGKDLLDAFTQYCLTYGYPKTISADNGKEFDNQDMKQFCKENGIQIAHGSPRTPTTQGLVERANRTWKENARAVIMSKVQKKVDKWCKCTLEISYTMNITYHSAIKTTPYEVTFGFKAHRETLTTSNPDKDQTPEDHLHVAAKEQGTLADPLYNDQTPEDHVHVATEEQGTLADPLYNDQTPDDHLLVALEEQGTLADPLNTLQSPVQTDSMSPKKQSRTKRSSSHDNGTNEVDSRQQKRKKQSRAELRATLNFRKFKVALNPTNRIFAETLPKVVSCHPYQMLII